MLRYVIGCMIDINIIIFFAVCAIFAAIYLYLYACSGGSEHMNEGTFMRLRELDDVGYNHRDNVKQNLSAGDYPMCTQNIVTDGDGVHHCNDVPEFKQDIRYLYGSTKWVESTYPSVTYKPYSSVQHIINGPDYFHDRQDISLTGIHNVDII